MWEGHPCRRGRSDVSQSSAKPRQNRRVQLTGKEPQFKQLSRGSVCSDRQRRWMLWGASAWFFINVGILPRVLAGTSVSSWLSGTRDGPADGPTSPRRGWLYALHWPLRHWAEGSTGSSSLLFRQDWLAQRTAAFETNGNLLFIQIFWLFLNSMKLDDAWLIHVMLCAPRANEPIHSFPRYLRHSTSSRCYFPVLTTPGLYCIIGYKPIISPLTGSGKWSSIMRQTVLLRPFFSQ